MHSNRSRWLFAIPASASLGAWAETLTCPGLVAQDTINTVASLILLWITRGIVGLRVDEQSEITGLDVSQHREHMGA